MEVARLKRVVARALPGSPPAFTSLKIIMTGKPGVGRSSATFVKLSDNLPDCSSFEVTKTGKPAIGWSSVTLVELEDGEP